MDIYARMPNPEYKNEGGLHVCTIGVRENTMSTNLILEKSTLVEERKPQNIGIYLQVCSISEGHLDHGKRSYNPNQSTTAYINIENMIRRSILKCYIRKKKYSMQQ